MPESAWKRDFVNSDVTGNSWEFLEIDGQRVTDYAKITEEHNSRVAALEQRIADAIAILDQAGDNRDEALARLREVKG